MSTRNRAAKGEAGAPLLEILRRRGLVRVRDLVRIDPNAKMHLWRLARRGQVQQFGRGIYGLATHPFTEHHSYAVVCKQAPHAVVCLLSALAFHQLTSQNPGPVWLAIGQGDWTPRIVAPKIRVIRFSAKALAEGVEKTKIEGVEVRVYGVAKTVADLFKFRNKVGLEVAMEALRESLRQRRCTVDDLIRYSRVCRVERIMRPYLEMAIAS